METQGFGVALTDQQIAATAVGVVENLLSSSLSNFDKQRQLDALFRQYDRETQQKLAAFIIAAGGDVAVVSAALEYSAKEPIWKKWWFWAAVGGTTVVAAGAATYFVRKSR